MPVWYPAVSNCAFPNIIELLAVSLAMAADAFLERV